MIALLISLNFTPPTVSYAARTWGPLAEFIILLSVSTFIILFLIQFMENPEKVWRSFEGKPRKKPQEKGKP